MISAGTARRSAGSAVKQTPIRRLGDRLRQPLDGIGTVQTRSRSRRAPSLAPVRIVPVSPRSEGCAASPRITFIGIEKR